jgi:O-antigen ligase
MTAPDETEPVADPSPAARPHAFLRYTTARIALFVVALGLVWLVRLASGALLVIVALVVSGLASFALLGRQRAEVSAALFERRERRRSMIAARPSIQDDADRPEDAAQYRDE